MLRSRLYKDVNEGEGTRMRQYTTRGNWAGDEVSEEVLLDLCKQIWSKEQVPEGWKKCLLIKLPKKGNLNHCKNCHGSMHLNMASKMTVLQSDLKSVSRQKNCEKSMGF